MAGKILNRTFGTPEHKPVLSEQTSKTQNKKQMRNFLFTLFVAGTVSVTANAAYTGRVFIDKNKNGVFDKGEKAMKGIAVSDGLNVVRTDGNGSFTLPGHPKARFVFITTPSGFKSDNRHYIRIAGENAAYDFGLQPYRGGIGKDGSHKYLHIADTEIFNTENHGDWVNNVRDYAANEQAAFIIHTGDICYEKGLKAHIELMNTANMDCPVFYCIGNHDLVKGKYGEELFESLYGPVFYSFDAGSTHYIVTPMLGGDHAPSYSKEDVCTWIENDLAAVPAGKPVVVFNHDLWTYGDEFQFRYGNDKMLDLDAHNLKAWVYGHWHIHYIKKQGNVHTVSTGTLDKGGIDHSTSAFRVMHVDKKGDFRSELRYTYIRPTIRIASVADSVAPVLASGKVPLSVNVYSSVTPVKEVSYTCWVNGKNGLSPAKLGRQTDWNWYAEIPVPAKYAGQPVTVRVKAAFNDGQTAEAESTFVYRPEETPEVKPDADWSNLLGNAAHTGTTVSQLPLPLRLAWINSTGANLYMTSPVVAGGNVYTASVDEDLQGKAFVYALDGKTGGLLWKYPVRNSIKNTIAADEGRIYAQDAQGYLYALDAITGKLAWEKQLPVNGLPALIDGLAAAGGRVYAGTGKGLCAIDGKTGNTLWQNEGWNQAEGTTSTLALGNGMLIGSAQWRALYGNDAATGKLVWQFSRDGMSDRGASAAVHGNLLYIIARQSLFILETNTGNLIVRKELPYNLNVTSTPLLTDKEIIFGSADTGLIALDRETLDLKWQFKTGDALIYTSPYSRKPSATIETSPVATGKTVFAGASDGVLYGIDRESGSLVWKHETGAPVFGSVAVSGNALFATDFGGNVYAFTACGE